MTDADPPPAERGDQLREEAAAWFARMRGDDAAEHRTEFEAWLARGAAHRAAYNRIGAMFAEAKVLKGEPPVGQEERGSPRRSFLPLGAVAIAGIVAVGSIVSLTQHHPRRQIAAIDRKPVSSDTIRTIALARDSRAILDAGANVVPAVGGDDTISRLETGRARFVLAHAGLASQVLAGNVALRSAGGTVDLWLRPDGTVDVQPIAGDVQVASAVADGAVRPRFARLLVGQRYQLDPKGRIVRRSASIDPDWPSGILEFRATPLEEVIDAANRYSPIKISLADPMLGERRVSGRFRVDDPVVLAQRLASALSLGLDRSQPGRLILLPQKN